MRQLAGTLNRGWLGVLGVVLLLVGLLGILVTTGIFAGLGLPGPANGSPLLGGAVTGAATATWAAILVGLVGIVLGLLGLAWLLAQVPRTNAARAFRLHDETTGLTVCQPSVLAAAVEDEIKSYPGVTRASAVLRGTTNAPELTVKVNADDRTDLRQLLDTIHHQAATNLAQALDAPIAHLAVQLDIDRGDRTTRTLTR